MAKRLFAKFLAKQSQVYYFDDPDLNAAAAAHENIRSFCAAALGAPPPFGVGAAAGKTRIHQALKAASWDITRLYAPTDLGVPAFNIGSKIWASEDYANGLGLMINGAFVSKKQAEAARRNLPAQSSAFEIGTEPHALRSADTAGLIPSDISVTEETTRHLSNPGQKQ